MITHNHTILEMIEWAWFGVLQWIKFVVPDTILKPDWVGKDPPDWYTEVKSGASWRAAVGDDGYPLTHWFDRYFEAIGLQLGIWIDEAGEWAYNTVLQEILGQLGELSGLFNTWGDWLNYLWDFMGHSLPSRWSDLADAAHDLWLKLPVQIRNASMSWNALFDAARDEAVEIIEGLYAEAVEFAYYAKNWVVGAGLVIETWYMSTHFWLDDLMADFYGQIADALGEPWDELRRFANTKLQWYKDLYVYHRHDIEDFFADPITWLYEQVEPWILDHIW